jgi:hypothetical protein
MHKGRGTSHQGCSPNHLRTLQSIRTLPPWRGSYPHALGLKRRTRNPHRYRDSTTEIPSSKTASVASFGPINPRLLPSPLQGQVHECKPLPSGKTASLNDVDEFEGLPRPGVSRVSRMTPPRLATSGDKRDAKDGRDSDMVSFQYGRIGAS